MSHLRTWHTQEALSHRGWGWVVILLLHDLISQQHQEQRAKLLGILGFLEADFSNVSNLLAVRKGNWLLGNDK